MSDSHATRLLEIAVVLAVCGFLFFYGLGSFGLLGADEPRYAQIGAEMLARHDWAVPTLNGAPWLEKPPLLYWGEMASYAVFGVHDWAARVPVALMTSLMVLAIYFFVRRRLAEWALDAALITASLAAVIGFGRGASTDMPLAACFTIAMMAWITWWSEHPRQLRWLLVFYVFSALGMLAKGPVAPFLAGLIIVVFAALRREWKAVFETLWLPGIILFLAISLPWYIAVQLRTGDFFRIFILEHNLARFGTDLYRHKQPFWYYLPVVLLAMMPWTAILLAEIARLLRRARARELTEMPLTLFAALWFIVPILFFSISQSKLPGYALPSIPAGAMLVVDYLKKKEEGSIPLGVALLHAICCGALFAGVLLSPHFLLRVRPSGTAIAIAAVTGAIIFVAVAFAFARRGVRWAHAATLVPVLLAVAFIVKVVAPTVDTTQSARPVAAKIHSLDYPDASPVVVFQVKRDIEYGLPYYRRAAAIRYEEGALPMPTMIVVKSGARVELERVLPPNTVLAHVADFEPQRLEFYMASSGR